MDPEHCGVFPVIVPGVGGIPENTASLLAGLVTAPLHVPVAVTDTVSLLPALYGTLNVMEMPLFAPTTGQLFVVFQVYPVGKTPLTGDIE